MKDQSFLLHFCSFFRTGPTSPSPPPPPWSFFNPCGPEFSQNHPQVRELKLIGCAPSWCFWTLVWLISQSEFFLKTSKFFFQNAAFPTPSHPFVEQETWIVVNVFNMHQYDWEMHMLRIPVSYLQLPVYCVVYFLSASLKFICTGVLIQEIQISRTGRCFHQKKRSL